MLTLTGNMTLRRVKISAGGGPPPVVNDMWASLYEYKSASAHHMYGYLGGANIDNAGNIVAIGASDGSDNMMTVVKWDGYGNMLWQKQFGINDNWNGLYGEFIVFDSSNNIYAFSTNDSNTGTASVIKLSSSGDLLWQKEIASTNGNSVFPTSAWVVSDGIVSTANDGNAAVLFKFDLDGNLLWADSFYSEVTSTTGPCFVLLEGNGYILSKNEMDYWAGYAKYISILDNQRNITTSKKIYVTNQSYNNRISHQFAKDALGNYYCSFNQAIVKLDSAFNVVWVKDAVDNTFNATVATIKTYNNEIYFLMFSGQILKYNPVSDTFVYYWVADTPDGTPGTWYYNSTFGCLNITDSHIIVGGFTNNKGYVSVVPRDLASYPGLECKANGVVTYPGSTLTLTDITSLNVINVADYTPTTTAAILDVATTTFDFSNASNSNVSGPYTPYTHMDLPAFTADPSQGEAPLTVTFTNTSPGIYTSFLWDFDDGTTSTEVNPVHTYTTTPASFVVKLTGTAGSVSNFITHQININILDPSFTVDPTQGSTPLTVTFTNTSPYGYNSFFWDFGDGTTSTDTTPAPHQYSTPGNYTITLTGYYAGGSTNVANTVFVSPAVNFTSDVRSGNVPLTVTFTDTSPVTPSLWVWNFGDSSQDWIISSPSVQHEYTAPGTYTVSMHASVNGIAGSEIKTNYITVSSIYQGVWDPITNTPTLTDGSGTSGTTYLSNGSATVDLGNGPITVNTGDTIKNDNGTWFTIPAGQPGSGTTYKGTWIPTTNTPTLSDSTGVVGEMYIAASSGTVDLGSGPLTFSPGDYAIHNGTVWQLMPEYQSGIGSPLIYTIDSSRAQNNYTLNVIYDSNNNFSVDWGDNTTETYTGGGQFTHHYATTGIYTITICGHMSSFTNPQNTSQRNITSVQTFGNIGIVNMDYLFADCDELTSVPQTLPSTVRSLRGMFNRVTTFNQSLSNWDVSKVTDMGFMFAGATSFNQPLNNWNTGNVTNMSYMFNGATAFNQPLNNWDTSNVIGMNSMFLEATSFNQPIGNWDTSKVVSMFGMFQNAYAFNQSLNNWNTSNVTNMSWMFASAREFNGDISSWNTNKVTDMSFMFTGATVFNSDISNWNTSNVVYMHNMFNAAETFNRNISNWDTSNVTYMHNMFNGARSFDQPIGNWNVSKVADMSNVFASATTFNQSLNNWNTSNVTNMSWMFASATAFNGNISSWNTSNVTNMQSMFSYCESFNCDISNWDTSKVTDMSGMFIDAVSFNRPIGNWNTGSVVHMASMFRSYNINTGPYLIFNQPLNNWNTGNVTNMSWMFAGATSFNQPLNNWDTSNLLYVERMFENATAFNGDIGSWDTSKVTDMTGMFNGATSFNQPLNNWNTSNVTSMRELFLNATAFNRDISSWDTSKVTSMLVMFNGATSFNQPLNNWNTSNVTNMYCMFCGAENFNQPLNNWNTGNVTNMASMFNNATAFNQPLNNWNTSNVTNMSLMFANRPAFNQPIGNWNVSNVTNMRGMFFGATLFNQPIGNWNVSKVTDMNTMFSFAAAFNQPLNSWNTSNVIDMGGMFEGAMSFNQPIGNWNVSNVTNMNSMLTYATHFNQNISGLNTTIPYYPNSFAYATQIAPTRNPTTHQLEAPNLPQQWYPWGMTP